MNKAIHVASRNAWRRWLRSNHKKASEVWLVYYRKATGRARLAYNDAVEEALCFGWIDSRVRSLDGQRFAQRFTPRRQGAAYSQANKERLVRMLAAGKVLKSVARDLPAFEQPGRLKIPQDILAALKGDEHAWRNFRRFSPSYKRIRIAFIEGARSRPSEFRKRLAYFVRMTASNRQFGFGGIEKYY